VPVIERKLFSPTIVLYSSSS